MTEQDSWRREAWADEPGKVSVFLAGVCLMRLACLSPMADRT